MRLVRQFFLSSQLFVRLWYNVSMSMYECKHGNRGVNGLCGYSRSWAPSTRPQRYPPGSAEAAHPPGEYASSYSVETQRGQLCCSVTASSCLPCPGAQALRQLAQPPRSPRGRSPRQTARQQLRARRTRRQRRMCRRRTRRAPTLTRPTLSRRRSPAVPSCAFLVYLPAHACETCITYHGKPCSSYTDSEHTLCRMLTRSLSASGAHWGFRVLFLHAAFPAP